MRVIKIIILLLVAGVWPFQGNFQSEIELGMSRDVVLDSVLREHQINELVRQKVIESMDISIEEYQDILDKMEFWRMMKQNYESEDLEFFNS
jgi:hypothetical protein